MKKFLFLPLFLVLLFVLILNHGIISLNIVGNNVHSSYLKECDPETVRMEKSTSLGFPTEITVKGWNCVEPDNSGSAYTAQVWDHFFWIL